MTDHAGPQVPHEAEQPAEEQTERTPRRRIVVLASAATLLGLLVLAVASVAFLTRTSFGRERIRRFAVGQLARAVHGKLYVGRLGGSILGDITADSIELRDEQDSLFVATGPVAFKFDPRDLFDMRLMLFDVRVTNPVVNINLDSTGMVNFRKIFPPGKPGGPVRTGRGWGDYIAVRNAVMRNLTLRVTNPWTPDSTLLGARRDSAIRAALGGKDRVIRRVGSHYAQTLTWTRGSLTLDSARLDDRNPGGRYFHVANLDLIGYAPPFNARNVHGTARMLGDSIWFDAPHLDLPASTGSAKGKVWWGGSGPVRYDVAIIGDSVALNDIAWVYPTLPRTGGGKMKLLMRSEKDPHIIDYVITDMDVRSTASWLRGQMTWVVGGPVLALKDVDLIAEPVDFKLIETLAGEPLPYPFRGTLTGTVKARGGPLNRFVVDASDIVFRDANVPGATAVGRGRGELDILEPSKTAFHDFVVDLDQLDLRSVQFLNPSFPRFNGIIAGRTTLDSTYLDIRFRDADLTHSDGTGPISHVTGAGRVTFAENTVYDVALNALPLSFTTFKRAYVGGHVPFKGEYSGPLRLEGTLQDLAVSTDLRGPAGQVAYDGRVDADSVGGYGAHGTLRFNALDLRTFLDTAITPTTELTGTSDLDIAGETVPALAGSVTVDLDRSLVDSVRIYPSRARLRFTNRRMYVDTLGVQSAIASLTARGALGLAPEIRDSVVAHFAADSLGGLRKYLTKAPAVTVDGTPQDGESATVDSLQGAVNGDATLTGSVDTLGVTANVHADNVDAVGVRANTANAHFVFDDVTRNRHGTARLTAERVAASGIQLDSVRAELALADTSSGTFTAGINATNGPIVTTAGAIAVAGDTTTARFSALSLAIREHRLELARPAALRVSPGRLTLDTVQLVGAKSEQITIAADLPDSGRIRALVRVDSVHMADISDLAQLRASLGGGLSGSIQAEGTKANPVLDVQATITGGKVGQVNIARIALQGHYANDRMIGGLRVIQQDTTVLDVSANLPLKLPKTLLRDTMRVAIRAQDVDMRLIESFTPAVTNASGRFSAVIDFAGPEGSRTLVGGVQIAKGTASFRDAGVALREINADITARNDSILISRFSMMSGDVPDNRLSLRGIVASPLDSAKRYFDLSVSAFQFHALGNRKLADLYLSTSPDLQFTGRALGDTLSGTVIVNRGIIFMPEPTDKQIITLQNADLKALGLDTAVAQRLQLLPRTPPSKYLQNLAVENVNIVMGPDVSVRSVESREINIKLGGQIAVTRRFLDGKPQLVLDGSLQTERGRYVLNLGPVFQRTFDIESGTMTFFGDRDFNPTVNISAIYTSRQFSATYGGRNTLRIRAHVTGTFLAPKVSLESADTLNISQSDLISYLISGAPSFEIGGGFRQNYSQLSDIVLGSAASYLATRLSGGVFDYVEVQTAQNRLGIGSLQQSSERGLLAGTQLGIGKQINDRTFVAMSAGVCQVSQIFGGRPDLASIATSLGLKAEYQVKKDMGVSASVEPSLSSLLCTPEHGFSTSVRQLGFDLFRTIRW